MPNIGRPSKACVTCKRRKVKCSETPPKCRACARLGLTCEWKDISVFRQQDDWAGKLVERRVKQAKLRRGDSPASGATSPTSPPEARSSPTRSTVQNAVELLAPGRPLSKQLTSDMENAALHRFYMEYAYTSGTCPFLYLVAPLYEEASTPSCLHSAVHAVSMATMARQFKRHEIMTKAERWYGKALKNLAAALNQTEVAKHDGTLLAVALLGLYETVIFSGTPGKKELNQIHSQGRLAVLRLRGPEQLGEKVGRNLFTLVYHQQLIGSFFDGGSTMDEYPSWMSQWYPETPVARLETLMHEVSVIVSGIRRALAREDAPSLRGLLERGKDMEDTLATIISDLLGSWPHPEVVLARLIGSECAADIPKQLEFDFEDLSDNDMSRYLIITRALVANIFRAIRIQLLQALNSAVPYLLDAEVGLDDRFAALVQRSSRVMMVLAENICNDLPLAIADYEDDTQPREPRIHGRAIRAWAQLFPLESAMSVKWLSDQQKERAAQLMEYTMGILGMHMHDKATGDVDYTALVAIRQLRDDSP
ncbi:hypothetical protein DPSP01_008419 [Paraphaeosphaeria sporulosa]|uniref:Zn(2)-C6 fungal-type domain-containing protein n=1 Tax=Paraphaeosphaeria sporulosa TaxID=1460663 RepID=A0A177C9B7_9PLEO|nr:uncharacterized protein CC84DRAFT_1176579 [Paraphaeosphaeria sporulosa]OAG04344.1 hypothetical protein CC84DRAFT_1176579 [Paraphaeosphaeria sporulosa]